MTRAARGGEPRPCRPTRRSHLKTLIVGLCALVLLAQVAAAAIGEREASAAPQTKSSSTRDARSLSLDARLALKQEALRKYRAIIRFFETRRRLLALETSAEKAYIVLRHAREGARKAAREVAYYERLIRERDALRLAHAPPRVAICTVFGRYCRQAISVAWCESRLTTTAQNGQYLGLFQMGSSERRLFGHGQTAHRQAIAAHRYFVLSGRDWSPWGCHWAAS
jgi:hypothetical protein